jgi:hypothetical protein
LNDEHEANFAVLKEASHEVVSDLDRAAGFAWRKALDVEH